MNEKETLIPLDEYKNIVFQFADEVEIHYNNFYPRILPIAFWNEWHSKRKGESENDK